MSELIKRQAIERIAIIAYNAIDPAASFDKRIKRAMAISEAIVGLPELAEIVAANELAKPKQTNAERDAAIFDGAADGGPYQKATTDWSLSSLSRIYSFIDDERIRKMEHTK